MQQETHSGPPRFPDAPANIKALPIDHRGYPVPYFVAWVDGKPDHRVIDAAKLLPAIQKRLCWICGQRLGTYLAFAIGPMCAITRTTSEPPSHRECAEFAVKACPFIAIPAKARRDKHMPDDVHEPAGICLMRNPGAIALWICKGFQHFNVGNGLLFEVGPPTDVHWYAEGRRATRAEVEQSIAGGLPNLIELARQEGKLALLELHEKLAIANRLLPPAERDAGATP